MNDKISAMIEAMEAAGAEPALIVAAIKNLVAIEVQKSEVKAERRREQTRIRVREHRARNAGNAVQDDVTEVTQCNALHGDVTQSNAGNALPPSPSPSPSPLEPPIPAHTPAPGNIKPAQERPRETASGGDWSATDRQEWFDENFAAFKAEYPRRGGSYDWPRAERSLKKSVLKPTREASEAAYRQVMEGLKRYAQFCEATGNARTEFVRMPATWLNGQGWTEEYKLPESRPKQGTLAEPTGQSKRDRLMERLNVGGGSGS